MECESQFAKNFMSRTLEIVKDYDGNYNADLLINKLSKYISN